MKLVKHISFALTAFAAFAFFLCAFAACGREKTVQCSVSAQDGETLVLVADRGDGSGSLYDALVRLQAEKALTFEGYTGDYGFTITAVNGVENKEDWSACWMIYTDLREYDGAVYASDEYGTFVYGGQTYASASYGASALPVIAGHTYVLHYDVFS